MNSEVILDVKNLVTVFETESGEIRAVDDVSFSVKKGRTLGIVGESGCGKSVTSLSIMGLVPHPPGRIVSGEILFKGRDLLKLSPKEIRSLRGHEMAMIFQEPMTSLNPVFTIGNQIQEAILIHQKISRKEARDLAVKMLRLVKIPSPENRFDDYPHQLSGGMRQRVMIAMALSCSPSLLICDEPTTALDVTIQAQILELMKQLRKDLGMSMILITHDLGVIAETAHDVVVMYAGKIIERASVHDLFERPMHPYTQGLLASIPRLDAKVRKVPLKAIPGIVPSMTELPIGCRFQDRCPYVFDRCRKEEPQERFIKTASPENLHGVACHREEIS